MDIWLGCVYKEFFSVLVERIFALGIICWFDPDAVVWGQVMAVVSRAIVTVTVLQVPCLQLLPHQL